MDRVGKVTLWKGAARPTGGERPPLIGAAGPVRAAASRPGKPLPLALVEELERNWALSAAVILAAILIVSAL